MMNTARTLIPLVFLLACATPRQKVDLRASPQLGEDDAPIEIVVFSDFQCAFCKRTAQELARIYRTRPNRVKIYYKYFPLSYHPEAMNAAKAAEAARLQGKFWPMHDLLFANATSLTAKSYIRFAEQLGLDIERFKVDFAARETERRVRADRAEGDALGVGGTPYILINGTRFRGSYAYIEDRLESF